MLNLILRTVFLFAGLLWMMRLMGKRQIGQLQPYEFVLTLIAADLITTPMQNLNFPLLWGIIPVYTLLSCGLLLSMLSLKSEKIRRLVCGKPRILIDKGEILFDSLGKVRYTIHDLTEQLRTKDVFDISQVYYAILETNGQLSVILRQDASPLTPAALSGDCAQEELTLALIVDGKYQMNNLDQLKITRKEVERYLHGQHIEKIGQVLLLTYDGRTFHLIRNQKR